MDALHSRTWLAVRGKSAEGICDALGLVAGMAVTRPRTFALEGAMSDVGWYLIVAAGRDHRLIQTPVVAQLSAGCDVLTCTVDERNLSSAASGWHNGLRVWSVSYEGEERPGEVMTEGELPPAVAAVRQQLIAKSQLPDAGDLLLDPLFEIPIEGVRSFIAYRPDEPNPAFDGRFVLLQAINPTVMQRLFGG